MTRSPRGRSPARGSACSPEPRPSGRVRREEGRPGWAAGRLARAALSLKRRGPRQGERAEARALLAAICGWVTEDLDTADLQ
jgi:hypothetical protein